MIYHWQRKVTPFMYLFAFCKNFIIWFVAGRHRFYGFDEFYLDLYYDASVKLPRSKIFVSSWFPASISPLQLKIFDCNAVYDEP